MIDSLVSESVVSIQDEGSYRRDTIERATESINVSRQCYNSVITLSR